MVESSRRRERNSNGARWPRPGGPGGNAHSNAIATGRGQCDRIASVSESGCSREKNGGRLRQGPARRSGPGFRRLTEALPVLPELAAELADAGRTEAVLASDGEGALAPQQILNDMAVTLRPAGQPGRKVQAEGHLLGHWR